MIYTYTHTKLYTLNQMAESGGAAKYTDCNYEEG